MKLFCKQHTLVAQVVRKLSTFVETDLFKSFENKKDLVVLDVAKSNGIALMGLNFREKMNALSKEFVKEMDTVLTNLQSDNSIRGLLIFSTVPGIFCAGADLKERALIPDEQVPSLVRGLRMLFHKIYKLEFPTIAAIDGAALGGGLEMALTCDLRYTSMHPKVKIGLVETGWGLIPGAGGTQRLPRLIGESKAKQLIYSASILNGKQAFEFGIVNDISQSEQEYSASVMALSVLQTISKKGPLAMKEAKKAIEKGLTLKIEDGLDYEGECYKMIVPTKDRKEGMKAFAEKRKPIFIGE